MRWRKNGGSTRSDNGLLPNSNGRFRINAGRPFWFRTFGLLILTGPLLIARGDNPHYLLEQFSIG